MKRRILFAGIAGLPVGFCYVAGAALETDKTIDLLQKSFYGKWFAGSLLAACLIGVLFWGIEHFKWDRKECGKELPVFRTHVFSVLILMACWLPALLSIFPGAFSYDALDELTQVQTGMLTAHHPVLHVLFLGGIVEGLHSITGSYNIGIAVYSILQMLIVANVLAATLDFMREFAVPKWFRWMTLLFYGLSPVMQLFAICATKDVLFTAAQTMLLLYTLRMVCKRDEFFQKKSWKIGFCVSAFFAMTLRNNGLYVVLLLLLILFCYCKKERKPFGILAAGILLPYLLYAYPFQAVMHVAPGGVEEKLSVPIQQMARVYRFHCEELDPADLELLYEVLPEEYLVQYRPGISDFVKKGFRKEAYDAHKKEYFDLWLKWGKEYPLAYVNSFLLNTVDFWYPHAVVDGYEFDDGRTSYFDYMVDEPGNEVVLLPGLHAYYEKISYTVNGQKHPLAFLYLSPGWYFVVTWIVFMWLWYSKRYGMMIPMSILGFTFMTVLLGPIALVRYVLIFYYAFPIVCSLLVFTNRYEAKTKMQSI